jgi:hypothetical protein
VAQRPAASGSPARVALLLWPGPPPVPGRCLGPGSGPWTRVLRFIRCAALRASSGHPAHVASFVLHAPSVLSSGGPPSATAVARCMAIVGRRWLVRREGSPSPARSASAGGGEEVIARPRATVEGGATEQRSTRTRSLLMKVPACTADHSNS